MLWKTRNRRTFDPQASTRNVAKDVLYATKRHIKDDFFVNPLRVEQFWGHQKTLVEIKEGQLVFKF